MPQSKIQNLKSKILLAWSVHLYTAMGLVAAAVMAVLIFEGGDDNFRVALLLMILATVIDSTDGILARRAQVTKWTPGFDGRRLDDITDFHTYTSLPLLFIWRIGILPGALSWWLLAPLLASGYGFSQSDAKTKDGYFLGFPSYWNALAFYFYFLRPSPGIAIAFLVILALLTFVPLRYLYPLYGGRFGKLTIVLGVVWGVLLVLIASGTIEDRRTMVWTSVAFPTYYLLTSWWISLRRGK
ncbi:MAG: CDP-alcohol phosphatidyltransferase family protein [Acidobacteriota bacterium]